MVIIEDRVYIESLKDIMRFIANDSKSKALNFRNQLNKKLEKIPMPKDKDLLKVYKDAKQSIQRLNKILKPQWYLDDTTKKKKIRKK